MCAMALHDSLRELVSVRGAGVVDEAEELRGALDDFLAEEEATLGELNLLVDAVRLGALRRVLDVMDHGAVPEAAIREAGAALARDRGTDDPTRSCWALATLCFALGRVDEPMVRMFRGDAGTMPASAPPSAPHGQPPTPVISGPGTVDRPPTQVLQDHSSVPPPPAPPVSQPAPLPQSVQPQSVQPQSVQPQSVQPQSVQPQSVQPQSVQPPSPTVEVQAPPPPRPYGAPVPPVIPEERSGRGGIFLLVVLVALIIGGLVAAGVILLRSDNDDDPAASSNESSSSDNSSDNNSGGPRTERPLPDSVMLVPYGENDFSQVYRVDASTGRNEPLTPVDTDARLPTISPDRRTMTYQVGQSPTRIVVVDLATGDERALFPADSPCAASSRPAWSPDGSQVLVLCDPDGDRKANGIWLADSDGGGLTALVEDLGVKGSPTWISDTEFIYGLEDPVVGSTFWRTSVDGGTGVQVPIDVAGYLSHIDWSAEADRLLVLASPAADAEEGAIWTMDLDGQNPQLVVDGNYAHPVWSTDGTAIGGTVTDSYGAELLVTITLKPDGTGTALVVPDPPPGEVGIPVWGSR
jgi:Tol biopolymer transport system component